MREYDKKVQPKECANCGATLEVDLSKENITCPYCRSSYNVADLINESDAVKIQKIKSEAYREIELEKLKYEKEKNKMIQEERKIKEVQKGKFSKALLISAVIFGLSSIGMFTDGEILYGIIGIIQTVLFIVAYRMGNTYLNKKKRDIRVFLAVMGYGLILCYDGEDPELKEMAGRMSVIEWPTASVAKELPQPELDKGVIVTDSSKKFEVYIGETSKKEFKDYVKECKDRGFIVDYINEDIKYEAKNNKGMQIEIRYESNDMMYICIDE